MKVAHIGLKNLKGDESMKAVLLQASNAIHRISIPSYKPEEVLTLVFCYGSCLVALGLIIATFIWL
jgi:hypothetical protein